jgi:dodecin
MPVVKVVELLAESEESWEDAAKQAVEEATKTIRGVRSVYISEFQATVENEKVKSFRINAKVSFVFESGGGQAS